MARDVVATQPIVQAGLDPVLTAPTVDGDGDVIDTGRVFLWVENVGAVTRTVTLQTPVVVSGLDLAEQQVIVPAGEQRLIGPLKPSIFGRPAGTPDAGKAYVDYDSEADLLRRVFSL